jgi:WD40 repeat protein
MPVLVFQCSNRIQSRGAGLTISAHRHTLLVLPISANAGPGKTSMITSVHRSTLRRATAGVLILLATNAAAQTAAPQLRLVAPSRYWVPERAILSPDDRFILSIASSGTNARLREIKTGRELRTFAHSDEVLAAAFSPDARMVATSSKDGTTRLWNAATGALIRQFGDTGGSWVNAVAWSATGEEIATGNLNELRIWSVENGIERRRIETSKSTIEALAYSPNGALIAALRGDGDLEIWESATGRQLHRMQGHKHFGGQVDFSPNGELLLSASMTDSSVNVWDVSTGALVRSLPHGNGIRSAAFSPDGSVVMTIPTQGEFGWGNEILGWDVQSGRQLWELESADSPAHAMFAHDGRSIIAMGFYNSISVWDARDRNLVSRFRDHSRAAMSAAFSPDGKQIVSTHNDVVVWEAASGREIRREKRVEAIAAFSPSGKWLMAIGTDSTSLWQSDAANDEWRLASVRLSVQRGGARGNPDGAFSRDEKVLVTAGGDSAVHVWDLAIRREMLRLSHDKLIYTTALSPDGRYVVTATEDTLRAFDARNGKLLWRSALRWPLTVVFAPGGDAVAIGSAENDIVLLDPRSGAELGRFIGHSDRVNSAAFRRDGSELVSSSDDETIRVWDVASRREKRRLHLGADVGWVSFSPDQRFLVSASDDNSIRLWDAASGTELYRRVAIDSTDWVVIAPDGRFDGTEAGMRQMHYAYGMETLGLEAFFDRFYTPGLAGLALANAPYDGPDIRRGFQMPPAIRIASPVSGTTSDRRVMVEIEATDRGGGVEDVRLYHNGAHVAGGTRGFGVPSSRVCRQGAICFNVELLAGPNTLEATGFSRDRTEAERARVTLSVAAAKPSATLHVLAVGINKYRNPRYNLNYGRADASAVADSLRRGAPGIFATIRIDTLFDDDATRANIATGFARIAAEARPEDVFVFYYAGHGTTEKIGDSTKFFLVPTDVTQMSDPAALIRQGISGDQLRALFDAVPARKRLMVIDACQSGEMIEGFARRGAAEERAIAQLARSSGIFMMSATDSEQFAAEVGALGHGVLTYAFLAALGADGATPHERTAREIIALAERMAPELAAKYRGKPQYPNVHSHGMDFPLIVR